MLKSLERNRARGYGTPLELATDIERYLHMKENPCISLTAK